MTTGPVLCIYARRDEAHWQSLLRHLQTMQPAPVILDWHSVSPGAVLATERARWLAEAQTIVLLLSAEFFADVACRTAALEVVARRPIPVLLRSVTLPKELADLVPLPRDGSPIVAPGRDHDALWTEVVGEIRDVMDHPKDPPRSIGADMEVHLDAVIHYRTMDGAASHTPPERPPEGLRVPALLARLRADWPARRGLLDQAARELGAWLYAPFASERLRRLVEAWRQRQTRARLMLVVPDDYADWPWELAQPPGLEDPPAVHEALTVLRQRREAAPALPGNLAIDLCGPTTRVEPLRAVIHEAVERRVPVACPLRPQAPLRHAVGAAAELLPHGDRPPFLAVLQATDVPARPGELFGRWHQHGAAAVVLCASGFEGAEAETFARQLYAGLLCRGEALDLAAQRARTALYQRGGEPICWAFLAVSVKGEAPLLRPSAPAPPPPSASIHDFGHEEQATLLKRFMGSRAPLVIVVHGEEGRGQRHVLSRVQVDLERAGNVLWKPVVTMRWHHIGEPLLTRHKLAGGIARALDVSDQGTQQELEDRLSRTVADRCAGGMVLVIDLAEVLCATKEVHCEALRELTTKLWPAVMNGALAFRSELPVFLLVGVAYRRARADKAVRERVRGELQALGKLEAGVLPGQVRIRVLPELQEIDRDYIIEFLMDACHLRRAEAEAHADYVLDHGAAHWRNEDLIARMAQLLADLRHARKS